MVVLDDETLPGSSESSGLIAYNRPFHEKLTILWQSSVPVKIPCERVCMSSPFSLRSTLASDPADRQ